MSWSCSALTLSGALTARKSATTLSMACLKPSSVWRSCAAVLVEVIWPESSSNFVAKSFWALLTAST